ncbi:beta-ketoacyl synthase chain length factor [Aureispira anguillae]|uniref:Beta-ketoacyl synthase chain length factor n=1 Tax=Aureispira anguillae TaxID=2864201 RepID=A0A916DVY9_9BACT|nr:beta-ketoacyl synthase chain length factor [Aureispira anguillae]BDS15639.1 beta-ketoacyl synthase chain length factor [Aureispira anguillae]
MKKEIYINGIGNISPQATFYQSMGEELAQPNGAFFSCQEPNYKEFIERKRLRRMSRIVRMGLATAYKALEEAQNPTVDAIISGTAWGCVKDTEKFLETIIENKEEYLTPTAFVQSTHNTVAGQIALLHHNNCYNMSYVQGNVSFESALMDAMLLFYDKQAKNILVNGIDEQTDQLHTLLTRLKCAQPEQRIMGEGAACFILSEQLLDNSYAKLAGITTLYRPKDTNVVKNSIFQLLQEQQLSVDAIDLVLSGNEDPSFETQLCSKAALRSYKKLCGEYPTSTAFAMAIAAQILKNDTATKTALDLAEKEINHILIYNQHQNINHSIILLSKIDC